MSLDVIFLTFGQNYVARSKSNQLLHFSLPPLFLSLSTYHTKHELQKKLPLTALSQAMVDGGAQLGEDSLIG